MPVYEFSCRACGHGFEELVGSHVGKEPGSVRCPACGAGDPQRLISGPAPTPRALTANQKRRLEDKRGVDRDGAKERFRKQRAAERRARSGRSGG